MPIRSNRVVGKGKSKAVQTSTNWNEGLILNKSCPRKEGTKVHHKYNRVPPQTEKRVESSRGGGKEKGGG